MHRPSLLVAIVIAAAVALAVASSADAQPVGRVWLVDNSETKAGTFTVNETDGGVTMNIRCEVPIQDGGVSTWYGDSQAGPAVRTSVLNLLDSAAVKSTCRPPR